jgi:hypothetical protein
MHQLTVGIGISYYGPASPAHRDAVRLFKNSVTEADRFRFQELHGSAYPEMAYAELCREALAEKVDVLFLLGHRRTGFTVDVIRQMCEEAFASGAIIGLSDLTFTAIPISALEKMAAAEEGTYSNTGVLDTGYSEGKARPFASPWIQKTDGSVDVKPWATGEYMTPEKALLVRALLAGVQFEHEPLVMGQQVSEPSWSFRVHEGDAKKRSENGIAHNYAFCVPCFGGLDHHQQDALWNLEIAGCTVIELRDCPYIDQARSWLTKKALELGCDGVFFIDHDIIFIPRDALDMIEKAEELQDVVSAVYCMRKTAHSLIGATHPEAGTEIGFFELGQLYRALYSGLGFSAIPKAVIHALDEKLPKLFSSYLNEELTPYYALDVNGTFYSGEDASFCARVQGLTVKMVPGSANPNGHDWELDPSPEKAMTSHKVWLDTSRRIFHRGSYDYGIEDHSFSVPRYAKLKGQLVGSRSEVKRFLADTGTIGVAAVLRGQGLDDHATEPHAIIEEHPPCKCGHGYVKHVERPKDATMWLPGWCSECSCAHYAPHVQYRGRT